MQMLPIIELCKYCPGMVTAMGVSMGLTSAAIMSKGTIAQKERWALPLMTLEKIGAWAITEPDSGSDAASLKTTAVRDGSELPLTADELIDLLSGSLASVAGRAVAGDVVITLGVFSLLSKLLGLEINLMFVTGLLTVIGFMPSISPSSTRRWRTLAPSWRHTAWRRRTSSR